MTENVNVMQEQLNSYLSSLNIVNTLDVNESEINAKLFTLPEEQLVTK